MSDSTRSSAAKAIYAALEEQFSETISPYGLGQIASLALTAYESHLQAEGMAVVPVEPSNEMLVAALGRALEWMKENGVTGLSPFADYPSPTETTRQVYRAMLSASPYGKAKEESK